MTLQDTARATLGPLLVTLFLAALVQVPNVAALERDEQVCELKDLTRILSLRVDPEAGYVCDVVYLKPDEGAVREVLWSARNNADYCRPRFDDMLEQLVSRGWECENTDEYVDAGSGSGDGAAPERSGDDEANSKGVKGTFRDRCVVDVASSANIAGSTSVKSYCDCITEEMASNDLAEGDAEVVFGGIASADAGDKRLDRLATSYESAVESCR